MTKNTSLTASLLCVLSILCFSNAIVQAESPDSLYTVATEKESQGKNAEAKAAYQQIIRQDPSSPAAEDARLRLSRRTALDLLAAGNDASAQTEIANAKKNFANHADLPWFLYCIGKQYENEKLKKNDQARELYEQIVGQYPNSPVARDARLRLSRRTALDLLAAGNDAAVQSEITKAKNEFAGHVDLPWFMLSIANQYSKLQKHDQAKGFYGQIVQQYPNSPIAKDAKLHFLKYQVQSKVVAGDDVAVQTAITNVKNELADHVGLPGFMLGVANQYEKLKKEDKARELYKQIVQQYPNSPEIKDAKLHFLKYEVQTMVASGNDVAVQSEITKVKNEFANHAGLSQFLYSIGNQYEELKRDDQAKEFYGQILQQYPNSPVAKSAGLHFSRRTALEFIAAGNDAAVQSEITKAKNEFTGHPDLPWFYLGIANQYEELKKRPEAKAVYQRILRDFSDTALLPGAKMGFVTYARFQISKFDICDLVRLGDDAKVQKELDNLLSQFKDNPDSLAEGVLIIGEEYYNKAFTDDTYAHLTNDAPAMLNKAIEIWQKPNYSENSKQKINSTYFTATAYMYMRQHETAVEWYKKMVTTWPKCEQCGNALRLMGICYASMAQSGGEKATEAIAGAETSWQAVIEKFPNDMMSYDAALRLANSRERNNDWLKAAEAYEFYLAHCGSDLRQIYSIYKLGRMYDLAEQKESAIASYKEYLQLASADEESVLAAKESLQRLEKN